MVQGRGVTVTIAAPLQQALVALFAMEGGEALSTTELIDGLWDDALPESPSGAVQIAVSRLRRALEPVGGQVVAEHGRYRLDAAALDIDVVDAQHRLDAARAARGAADPVTALGQVEAALALWRGPPLVGLERFPFHQWAQPRLAGLHTDLVEERNDALLAVGRHLEVIDEADRLVAREPWRERLRAQQMLALYRAGRQAEALRAYDALRTALVEELGVRPGPRVTALHHRILEQDPGLDVISPGHHEGRIPLGPALTSTATPFVGREAELDRFGAVWGEVRTGSGPHLLVLEGEPGIGKTRLATEVARRLGPDSIALTGRWSDPLGHPYQPFVTALRHLLAHLPARDARHVLGPAAGPARSLVVDGVPRLAADADDGTARSLLVAELAAALLATTTLGPVSLLLDDAHRAPQVALDVLERLLATSGHRLLLVATARGNVPDRSPALARLLDRCGPDRATLVRLGGLSGPEVVALCDQVRPDVPAGLRRQVHEASGGNPFFAAEVLRDLPPDDGEEAVPTRPPVNVHEAIRHRVARLGEPTRQVLEMAALAGSTFSSRALVALLPAGDGAVQHALDRATAAQLVEPERADDYRFLHDLTRQSITDSMPIADQEAGHERLARWCEDVDAPAATIAGHWLAAGAAHDRERFVSARAAGLDAGRRLDPFAAAHWHQVAFDHASDARERHEVLVDLGRAQFLAGDPDHRASLLAAGTWARRHADDDLLVAAALAASTDWASDAVVDQERVEVLTVAAAVAGAPADRCRILSTLAVELTWEEDPARRRRAADDAVAAGRRAADARELANALTGRVFATWEPVMLASRTADSAEALALFDDGDDTDDPVTVHNALGSRMATAIEAADLDTVDHCLDRSYALAAEVPLPMFTWGTALHRAWRVALADGLDAGEAAILRAQDLGARSGQASAQSTGALQMLYLRWQQGRLGEQLPVIVQAAAFGLPAGYCDALRAAAAADVGDLDLARRLVRDHAARSFGDLAPGMLWPAAMTAWGRAVAATGEREAAVLVGDLLAPWSDRVAFPGAWVLGPLAVPLARARSASDDTAAARAAAEAATDVARALGGAPWLVPADVAALAS